MGRPLPLAVAQRSLAALLAGAALALAGGGPAAAGELGLRQVLNPVSWFKGDEWRAAASSLRAMADQQEDAAESSVGHPELVEPLLRLALAEEANVGDEDAPDGRPGAGRRPWQPWLDELLQEIDSAWQRARTALARRLSQLKERVEAIVRRGPVNTPHAVAAAYMDAVERLHTADATAQFATRDRLAMRLVHGAVFTLARGLGLSLAFEDLGFETLAQDTDTATVRVTGTVVTYWAPTGAEPLSRVPLDAELPLVQRDNKWHMKGSDEVNAFLEELRAARGN